VIARAFFSFLVRDVRQQLSYKLSFLLDIASILFTATTFFFVARLFEGVSGTIFQDYSSGYFGFVLVGIAFSNYQSVGLNSFAQSLRQEQYVGTLESVLATPVRISTFLAGSALWDFIYATGEVIVYFAVAIVAFGLSLSQANVGAALLAVILSLTTFMGLGILSAAFILKFKKGNPVTWLIASAGELFGGVYFPTDILPDWMKSVSQWVPMTHALSALRKSLLSNAGVDVIGHDLAYLLGFTLIIWPVGILAFRLALRKSQEDGTLGHY
jgi:ABC-2 type transport system permease protein